MLVLDFINVGNGDSILVREMEGERLRFSMLVDCGHDSLERDDHPPVEDPRSCRIFAGDFLRSQGVAHLDILLVTHFHRDHIGGLGRVLETVTVGELLTPYAPPADSGPLDPDGDNGLPKAARNVLRWMDLYAGPSTYGSHQFLFGALFRAILCESAILAMLGTLYLLGYEGMHRAEGLACASRTGRKLRRVKVLAALQASAALYGLLAFCTLVPYFLLYDYSGIWNASVSSQFNYFSDMLVVRPFLTWGDFTVGQYLAAALALGAVLTAVFSLLASVCGTLVRSPYLAALALCLVCFGGLGLVSVLGELGWWAAYLIACFQPVTVWLSCSAWFTELGLNAVLPWQETIASGLNLLLLGGGVLLALGWFDRKDVS